MDYFAGIIVVLWYVALTTATVIVYKELKSHRKQLAQLTAALQEKNKNS
jgi:hypothetical protein